jgi:hypothetical protein
METMDPSAIVSPFGVEDGDTASFSSVTADLKRVEEE